MKEENLYLKWNLKNRNEIKLNKIYKNNFDIIMSKVSKIIYKTLQKLIYKTYKSAKLDES